MYEVVDNHLPDSHCFADNSQLYAPFKPDDLCAQCEANLAMENCMNDLRKWMQLKLNDGKLNF